MNILTFDQNRIYLDGSAFRILAGDVHYFRIHPSKWAQTLDLALDFGLNTIQTYVPWNAHEPRRGEFDFSGMLDLAAYLSLCKEKGLKVLLRPSPYICSEWDLGGLPAWLLTDRDLVLRSSDPRYLAAVEHYYDRLVPIFSPYLSTNGGPIIAVAIENEYGSYGNDHRYLAALADMLRQRGVDVPLYTTDVNDAQMLTFGRADKALFFGVNYRATPGLSLPAEKVAKAEGADKPFFVGEFWAGRSMHWGEPFYHRPPEEVATAFKEALELDGNVCFYMFAGGTNFGSMGGANYGKSYSPRPDTPVRYIPHTTSYDVDALVNESGQPTEKYFLCRDVLDEYLGKDKRPHIAPTHTTQSLTVTCSETADLFEQLDALTETQATSVRPKPMEDYGQNYGLILYTTTLDAINKPRVVLDLDKYRDRANVYIDNEFVATFTRDRGLPRIAAGVARSSAGLPLVTANGKRRRVDVLVENLGRLNFGKEMTDERKGLEGAVVCPPSMLFGYETRTLPLDDLSRLTWSQKPHTDHRPCFFKGTFDAKRGLDTYVDVSNFGHGHIWINGFDLGRYDSAGPQMTLYVPGDMLAERDNEIVILDIDPIGDRSCISLLDHEILEGEAQELT
ncbi:MAG: beta-galactosidase [Clostridia bacterium]|nr:beta-galactosidase [Clostridia bacterium]